MLSDLRATARQLPPRASVGLVLAILGPPSAHGCHHDGVHVEPGLTQRRRVALAQTALQHVEKGLTHHLHGSKQTHTTTCFLTHHSLVKLILESCVVMLVLQQMTVCWLPLPGASCLGWAESPPRCEGRRGGWRLHRSQASPGGHRHTHTHKCLKPASAETLNVCVLVAVAAVDRAHLGDMFQELGAGEAVLCGATVCVVVEKTGERGVQLKQSTTDTYHTFL